MDLFPLVKLALSGPEETLTLVLRCLGGSYTDVVMLERNISLLCSYWSYCGEKYTQGSAQALK